MKRSERARQGRQSERARLAFAFSARRAFARDRVLIATTYTVGGYVLVAAIPSAGKGNHMDLDDFWDEFEELMEAIDDGDGAQAEIAAPALVGFLERYRDAFPDIVKSIGDIPDRGAMFDRALQILAEKDSRDEPSH
jgi:hypothetical protein